MADQTNDQTVTADSATRGDANVQGEAQTHGDARTQGDAHAHQAKRPGGIARPTLRPRDRGGDGGRSVASSVARIRAAVATLVFLVAALAALVLALGAVLTALGANESNTLVSGVISLAGRLDGPFSDIFTFDSAVKQTLVNWSIAAAVYLIGGRILQRLIGP